MPERPAPATRPQPAALASARLDLDTLLRNRVRAMLAQADPHTGLPTDRERMSVSEDAASVDAQVRWFAEQVERHNDGEQRVAGRGRVLGYDEAVVIEGERGIEVVPADEYRDSPLYHEAKVGHVEQLIVGPDLLAFLRDSDDEDAVARAAEQLGLA